MAACEGKETQNIRIEAEMLFAVPVTFSRNRDEGGRCETPPLTSLATIDVR